MRHRTFFVVAHPHLEDANRRKTPKQSPSHATSSHVKYEIKTNKPFHRPLSQTARPEHQSSSRTVSDRTRCDGRPRRRSPGGRRQPRHARETVLLLNVQNGPAPNTFSERSQRPPFSVSGRLGPRMPIQSVHACAIFEFSARHCSSTFFASDGALWCSIPLSAHLPRSLSHSRLLSDTGPYSRPSTRHGAAG